jgi:hypothetical protein
MQLQINELKRSSLIRLYWKTGLKVLSAIQQPVIEMSDKLDPTVLKDRVRGLMDHRKMEDYINTIWIKTGAHFAVDTMRKLEPIMKGKPKKDLGVRMELKAEDSIDYWEDYFRRYTRERTAKITGEIMDTQAKLVNDIIDRNLEEGRLGGLGIEQIQRYLRTDLQDSLTEMNRYQAERIARTEVIGSSNTGSFDAATESGLDMKKAWLTSGLPNIRESHLEYEALGDQDMDYEYNTGLQYPSDPEGAPEEIINCRCTVVYNVDEGLQIGITEAPIPEPEIPEVTEIPVEAPKLGQFEIPSSIKTLEDLSDYAGQKFGIQIHPEMFRSNNPLTLERAKEILSQVASLKDGYKAEGFRLLGLDNRANVYASAEGGMKVNVNAGWFNDKDKLAEQFIKSDKKSFWHPRCIPDELSSRSIIDHEFGHILTTNDINGKYGVYGKLHNLKSNYTRAVNGLVKEASKIADKIMRDLAETPEQADSVTRGWRWGMNDKQRAVYDMREGWSRYKSTDLYISGLENLGGVNNLDIDKIRAKLEEFEHNFISDYAGSNLKEFTAEGFTSAKNGVNPSPWAKQVKEIIDNEYKR